MFTKKLTPTEFYLFYNGELIYKRWLTYGQSKVFPHVSGWTA